jgi:hypothetical protein
VLADLELKGRITIETYQKDLELMEETLVKERAQLTYLEQHME